MSKNQSTEIMSPDQAAFGAVRMVTAADLQRYVTERGAVFTNAIKLEAGQLIEGKYLGHGEIVEFTDDVSGEVKHQLTHKIEVGPGIVVEFLGAYQLDKKLGVTTGPIGGDGHPTIERAPSNLIGKTVVVARQADVNVGKGRRMTPYQVSEIKS